MPVSTDTIQVRIAHWEGETDQRLERVEQALRTQFYWLVALMLSLLALGLFRH